MALEVVICYGNDFISLGKQDKIDGQRNSNRIAISLGQRFCTLCIQYLYNSV